MFHIADIWKHLKVDGGPGIDKFDYLDLVAFNSVNSKKYLFTHNLLKAD